MCALNLWSAASMPPSPYVTHVPVMTGGYGYDDVRQFYATWFIGRWPADVQITPISRTVGQDRVINELIVSFTHDMEMPALLPGIAIRRHGESALQESTKAHLMGPCNHGEPQWSTMSDWTCR